MQLGSLVQWFTTKLSGPHKIIQGGQEMINGTGVLGKVLLLKFFKKYIF